MTSSLPQRRIHLIEDAHPGVRGRFARLIARFEVTGSPGRLVPMEGLRGLAVFLVFLVHYNGMFGGGLLPGSPSLSISRFLGVMGNWGVELFFLLSGFLIYGHLIRRPVPFLDFLARRLARIYPTFLVVFSAHLAVALLLLERPYLPGGAGARAVYVAQNLLLLPGIFPIRPLMAVTWSLSYEFFFYLIAPPLIAAFRLRSQPRGWRIALFAALVAIQWGAALAGAAFHLRLSMFVAGVLLYETIHSERRDFRLARSGEFLSIGGMCLGLAIATWLQMKGSSADFQVSSDGYRRVLQNAVLWFSMYFFFCLHGLGSSGAIARAFSWRPIRLFGR